MRIAIIDLGTNAVRFDVHQLGPGRRVVRLHRERLAVRLGEGVFETGRLSPQATARALAAFRSFRRTCADLRVDKVAAFGTSALREAADSEPALRRIRRATGIDVHVISGREEARLIAEGVLRGERGLRGRFALVDIGGGSTEVSLCRGRRVVASVSLDLGAARLQQTFLKSVPPAPASVQGLRRHVQAILASKLGRRFRAPLVIGSGGTIRALSRLNKRWCGQGKSISPQEAGRLAARLAPLDGRRLLRVPAMEPKRVDTILAGAVLFQEVMLALRAKKADPTEFALRDGVLEEELRARREGRPSPLSAHLPALLALAGRFHPRGGHWGQVTALARGLFDRLRALHGLDPVWRPYLEAAAALHDVGESVSPVHHERHSYYIVKNADFPSLSAEDYEFIAQLCLWHKGGPVDPEAVPFWRDTPRRRAFLKLLALLRVADALDRQHRGAVRLLGVRSGRGLVKLLVEGDGGDVELEALRLEQKKELFEKLFRVRIVLSG